MYMSMHMHRHRHMHRHIHIPIAHAHAHVAISSSKLARCTIPTYIHLLLTADYLCLQPVDYARHKQWEKLTARLLTPGCDNNACDECGRTALHYAAG